MSRDGLDSPNSETLNALLKQRELAERHGDAHLCEPAKARHHDGAGLADRRERLRNVFALRHSYRNNRRVRSLSVHNALRKRSGFLHGGEGVGGAELLRLFALEGDGIDGNHVTCTGVRRRPGPR